MDSIIREGEQALEGQMGGSNQGNMGGGGGGGGGNDNYQGGDNMGGGNQGYQGESNMREGNTGGGDNMNQQSGGNQSSGGGLLGGLEKTGENAMVDQEVNTFATKEGVPAGMDGMIDQFVNKEV